MKALKIKVVRKTHEIDATDESLGRLASRIAILLRGKNKATFQPHLDEGDCVVILNITAVKLTGQKRNQKVYHHYSGYPGGLKTKKMSDIFDKNPAEVLQRAVCQMLPPTRLRSAMMKRLTFKK
jgi:large subunit ribosomal protein L13